MTARRPALSLFAAPSLMLIATLAVAGCAVQTEGPAGPSENPTAADGKLIKPHCPAGQHAESSNEGIGGKLIWSCVADDPAVVTGPPPGPNPAACVGTVPVPAALAGQGCFPGTRIGVLQDPLAENSPTQHFAIFLCPTTAVIPASLGYDPGVPVCSPARPTQCEAVGTFTSISNSCVGDAPPGYEYVAQYFVGVLGHIIGSGCGGACSSISGWPLH
ncbi:MAG: hypothetical protein NVSMB47_02030 [Polyangiales bacterium]